MTERDKYLVWMASCAMIVYWASTKISVVFIGEKLLNIFQHFIKSARSNLPFREYRLNALSLRSYDMIEVVLWEDRDYIHLQIRASAALLQVTREHVMSSLPLCECQNPRCQCMCPCLCQCKPFWFTFQQI